MRVTACFERLNFLRSYEFTQEEEARKQRKLFVKKKKELEFQENSQKLQAFGTFSVGGEQTLQIVNAEIRFVGL